MFGLDLFILAAVTNSLDFTGLGQMMAFFASTIMIVLIGLPIVGFICRVRSARNWRRIGRDIDRQLVEEQARRWAMLVEENELRQRFGLPLISAPRTEVPPPYEAIAASTAAILASERATSRDVEARAETSAA